MSQDFLSQVIRSYGSTMQNLVSGYLEQGMKLLLTQQQQARESFRGATGMDLGAMTERCGDIVRPLLSTSRAQVLDHLERRGLVPLQDPSNADPAHLRNRVRPGITRGSHRRHGRRSGELARRRDR